MLNMISALAPGGYFGILTDNVICGRRFFLVNDILLDHVHILLSINL